MPGHSAAFSRAMKVDMQSDSGMTILKNILDEFCESYDVPYFHIGADEVRITNKDFVPEMTDFWNKEENKSLVATGWQLYKKHHSPTVDGRQCPPILRR